MQHMPLCWSGGLGQNRFNDAHMASDMEQAQFQFQPVRSIANQPLRDIHFMC